MGERSQKRNESHASEAIDSIIMSRLPFLRKNLSMRIMFLISLVWLLTTGCTWNPSDPVKHEDTCNWNGTDSLLFTHSIACPTEFEALSGPPLQSMISDVHSVKIVYEIASRRLFFVSSAAYPLHFDFCRDALGYKKSHGVFNDEQYTDSPERLYYLATVNYYESSGVYALEFFADDRISAQGVLTTYYAVKDSIYFKDKFKFLPVSTRFKQMTDQLQGVPMVTKEQIYNDQVYQALNSQEAYGWLKKVSSSTIDSAYLGRHDIVVTDGLPLDIPVIAGIITTEFQTPLCHINVLSFNRRTPNMALRTAWTDTTIAKLINKLVFLKVLPDSFIIRGATANEAEAFWNSREPKTPNILECHDDTSGLFDMKSLSHSSLLLVGAKAANFAELTKIRMGTDSLPVPEGAFAIPFYYYRKHLEANGIDKYLEFILADSLSKSDLQRRTSLLKNLRDSITKAPMDQAFISDVENKIRSGSYQRMRFRSSTNAEDIKGFNGAGLYDSYTAELDNPKKTVEEAIKKVYASLWTVRGFDEREYFKIDQRSVAMGILAHRSFPEEEVNGVAITGNIYNAGIPAYTINAQINEISVVQPPPGVISDQLLFYVWSNDAFENPVIEYISTSSINDNVPVMTDNEITLLAQWLSAIKQYFYFNVFNATNSPYTLFGMDVEFKLDKDNRKLYIKQARPYSE
jgi:pyruvate, water dikinase